MSLPTYRRRPQHIDDEFGFRVPRKHIAQVHRRHDALLRQLRAELPAERLTKSILGLALRERDPISDTYHALAQTICVREVLRTFVTNAPTTRSRVATEASRLSGLDFSPLAEAAIQITPGIGILAIDVANLRGRQTPEMLRLVTFAEAFSATRELMGAIPTGIPGDYTGVREYRQMPPPPDPGNSYLANIFVA